MASKRSTPQRTILIRFIGNINDANTNNFLRVLDEIQTLKGRKKLQIIINSGGGDSDCGLAIYDALRRSGLFIETIAEGVAASAGAIIFLAGKRRYITDHSAIMIHRPSIPINFSVTSDDCDVGFKRLKKLEEMFVDIICEKTGQKRARVISDMRRQRFFYAEEAVRYGLAHKVI